MAVIIRGAQVTDLEHVRTLTAQLGYQVDSATLLPRLSHALSSGDQEVFVAEMDGRVVGWVHVAVWQFMESGRVGMIAGLVVERSQRRHGVGRLLMGRAENWIAAQGCSIVRLWSSAGRVEAHRFYERLGYQNIKTQYSFGKSLDGRTQDLTSLVPRIVSDNPA
jgi:GNAT superfamily N-acetyltransferase